MREIIFALICMLFAFPSTSKANEALFGYIYTTDSLPKGEWEFEQWSTFRTGKAKGDYRALEIQDEIEYGITDRLSGSLYLHSSWLSTNGVYDPEDVSVNLPDQSNFNVNGMSLEFRYRLLSPYTDPIGLSFYLEPAMHIRDDMTGLDVIERELEFKVILQKNFFDDTLVIASNIMLEPEWEIADGAVARELWGEFTLGASYRIAPSWFVGLEFRNHREFPEMVFSNQEHSAYFLGPNVHYAAKEWWATLTILPQLAGYPNNLGIGADGTEISDGSRHLGQHEKLAVRLKVGVNL